MVRRRPIVVAVLALLLGLGIPETAPRAETSALPTEVTDQAFWQLVTECSEPGGAFRSDNFLSNERAFQRVLPELTRLPADGVYVGVGPEQNFTYVSALRPRVAFIIDIRRGNLVEHLLYKAFFELSANRNEFLSHLFARPPVSLPVGASADELFTAYERAAPSHVLYTQYLAAAIAHLTARHGFGLSQEDIEGLDYVYRAFYEGGPSLNYSFLNGSFGNGRFGGGFFPTYADLMVETDGHGRQRSYLASEENFQAVRALERRNAVIPIVGDFGGPKALRALGRYLKRYDARVTAFYTSNVEQYLFQSEDAWRKFYANVATLPIDARSTFIRSISNRGGGQYQNVPPGARASTRLSSIRAVIRQFESGQITAYRDVIALSR